MAYTYSEIDILDVIKGDTFDHNFEIVGFDEIVNVTEIKAQIKKYHESADVALEFRLSDGSIVKNGNFLNFRKTAQQMNIEAATYKYDVEFIIDGETYTLFGGTFKVLKDITNL